jgi:hypothetical protein
MASIFEKTSNEVRQEEITPRTKESMLWLTQKMKTIRLNSRPEVLRSPELKQRKQLLPTRPMIGSMHMFKYRPKHKATLPYYDEYPVVILVGKAEGGFLGLNLHYLPPVLRSRFLQFMYEKTNNNKFDETTRFTAMWKRINKGATRRYLAPMIKHYLTSNIPGYIAQVQSNEWEIASYLPFQRFRKANQNKVWLDAYAEIIQGPK